MQPEPSPEPDHPVIRVRGTFIDIGGVPAGKKRSSSAPPRRGPVDEESDDPNDDDYTAEWIERAKQLTAIHSNTHHDIDHDIADADINEGTVRNILDITGLQRGKEFCHDTADADINEGTVPNILDIRGSEKTCSGSFSLDAATLLQQVTEAESFFSEAVPIWASSVTLGETLPVLVKEDPPMATFGVESWEMQIANAARELGFLGRGSDVWPQRAQSNIASRNQWEASTLQDPIWPPASLPDFGHTCFVPEPEPPPVVTSKFGLEDPGPYKRLNLARSGPEKNTNTRWLEENILSKHPQHEAVGEPEITTLMVCDIPCRQTVEQIIDAIHVHGYANTFNMVYMPSKRPKYLQNLGYAFVNFKTPEYASSFLTDYQSYNFPDSKSQKLSYAKPARHQGYLENVDRYIKERGVGCLVTIDDAVNDGQPQTTWQR